MNRRSAVYGTTVGVGSGVRGEDEQPHRRLARRRCTALSVPTHGLEGEGVRGDARRCGEAGRWLGWVGEGLWQHNGDAEGRDWAADDGEGEGGEEGMGGLGNLPSGLSGWWGGQ